jgi:hypothetical protein
MMTMRPCRSAKCPASIFQPEGPASSGEAKSTMIATAQSTPRSGPGATKPATRISVAPVSIPGVSRTTAPNTSGSLRVVTT